MPRLTARDKALLDRDPFFALARPHPLEYDWKGQLAESNKDWHRAGALEMYIPMDFAKVMGLAHYAATMESLLRDILDQEICEPVEAVSNRAIAVENEDEVYIIPRSIARDIQELFDQFKPKE